MGYTARSAAGVGFTTASSALTAAQHDNNLSLLAKGLGLDPATVNTSTALVVGTHDSRELFANSVTTITLTLPQSTLIGTRFYGTNINSGQVLYANATGVLINGDSTLLSYTPQWNPFDFILVAANTYVRRA